ncbi:hypothetical protein HO173_005435 [Letharia columbiana]|uniref:Uncharacterized protein n=1 Tax=Letharia columbiana TaxID=112416 RepID=A0A8H6FWY7_9LECA|nr:uncharacterized protein HO173_005435 [Letharia columbiana]KAF6236344.1 hypothetical protein HO173_005435 [Letharia columbiana]
MRGTLSGKLSRFPYLQHLTTMTPDSLGFSRDRFEIQQDCGEERRDVAFLDGHAGDEDQVKNPGIVIHGIQRSASRNDNGMCMDWSPVVRR